MSGATHYCAFRGEPARKSEMVERVRAKWSQGQVFPLAYLKWRTDGGMVTMSGILAETQDPEQFIERTGLPLELAILCEGVVYSGVEFSEDENGPWGMSMQGSVPILAFAMEWLDAIAVGADLGGVVPRFMHSFLASVLAPDFAMAAHLSPAVRSCAERISGLWTREMDGVAVAPKEWRSVRADAMRASEGHGDPWSYSLAELVESLAWPARGLAPEFVPIFQVFMKDWRQFLAAPYLGIEDREIQMQSLIGLCEVNRAMRDPELAELPIETLLERSPHTKDAVLASMQPEMQARLKAAKQQAQPESDRVLRQLMDVLRGLIEAAGQPRSNLA
ncbi:hypothetical protein [Janthinobacterium aquaticum]|uniref:hypothetical protein n=1 Tax=Janthinobacterium sp. FT58W TaxID=2654254 RepID=UPI001264648E|nr:hypothetical protein [Janthinobacterium sp. FT58W]KAB8043387.1 hypothetical protein GCM43_08690 [Janthinobacterium sp. FT58W]